MWEYANEAHDEVDSFLVAIKSENSGHWVAIMTFDLSADPPISIQTKVT